MRLLLVVVAVSLIGCGPASQFDAQRAPSVDAGAPVAGARLLKVRLENSYAESIFTLRLALASDAGAVDGPLVFDEVRIPANQSKEIAITAATGDVLAIRATVISLGRPSNFTGQSRPVPADKSTLRLVYDYDLALAEFQLLFGWEQ